MEPPWGTKGRGEAAGDAPRRRREHPSGWSQRLAGRGTPERRRTGVPGGSGAPAPCGHRAGREAAAGAQRGPCAAIPALFVCLLARHAPSSRSQPLCRPPPRCSPCAGPSGSAALLPSPGELLPRPRQHQGLHRPLRGGAGGKQAAAAWLLIHHLQPPRGSARNASSRERWGRGEQGPRHPLAAALR